ncbi:hypothetical protein ZIOFF_042911 [Zingiber officinale]|uniref:Golgi SNAP receptor complex member 1 n=1 Tax=Zingiber officinale TaxID=94328 RepID=A0A8J5FUA6_ZINOF|nr:hypothetical protein ZIOFF_042911 [Zingiber officinale]
MSSTDAHESTGWEELRKEARKIEGDLDVKLSSYAKLASIFTHSSGTLSALPFSSPHFSILGIGGMSRQPITEGKNRLWSYAFCNGDNGSPTIGSNRSWKSMEMEIGSLLEKLLDVNDAMSRCAASTAATTSINQKLARHRDILHEFTQEFRRTKGNLNSMREHAELLNSVRDDITESKGSGGMSPRVSLLRERAAIHGNISDIEELISQAQATRSVLGSQGALYFDVQGKVKQLGDKFPVIRGVLVIIGKLVLHPMGYQKYAFDESSTLHPFLRYHVNNSPEELSSSPLLAPPPSISI